MSGIPGRRNPRKDQNQEKEGHTDRANEVKSTQHHITPKDYDDITDQILGRRRPRTIPKDQPLQGFHSTNNQLLKPRERDPDQLSSVSKVSQNVANITDVEEFERTLKLSEQAREALKKIQRFDRVLYAREAGRICKQPITNEVKRLQRIKNSNKTMRVKLFDNELTITAVYNLIKYLNEVNEQYEEFKQHKDAYETEQRKKKQAQFKKNLQMKRNKNLSKQREDQLTKMFSTIDKFIVEKNSQELSKALGQFLAKFELEQSVKEYLTIYTFLLQQIEQNHSLSLQNEHLKEVIQGLLQVNGEAHEEQLKRLQEKRRQVQDEIKRKKRGDPFIHNLNYLDTYYGRAIQNYQNDLESRSQASYQTHNRIVRKPKYPPRTPPSRPESNQNSHISHQDINQVEQLKKTIARMQAESKEKLKDLGNYEKLSAKLKQISHKIDENQNWTYEHNVIKNSPLFKQLSITETLFDVLGKLKNAHHEDKKPQVKAPEKTIPENQHEEIHKFLNDFIEIWRNTTFNPQRKKVQIERLSKKAGINDHKLLAQLQNLVHAHHEGEGSSIISQQVGSEASQNRYFRRTRNPDIVNDAIETNRLLLHGKNRQQSRAVSQQSKPIQKETNDKQKEELNQLRRQNHRLENELKQKQKDLENYEKLVVKIQEISHKVDENQNWTYDHNIIKNNPLFRNMSISGPLYELLAKLKAIINEKKNVQHKGPVQKNQGDKNHQQTHSFITLFIEICNNTTFNPKRKKIEIERLAKKNGINDEELLGKLETLAIPSAPIQSGSRQASEQNSEYAASEQSENKYYKRMRSPDLVNEVIDTNRMLSGRKPPRGRAVSQAHQPKNNEQAEGVQEKNAEVKKLEKEVKQLERKLQGERKILQAEQNKLEKQKQKMKEQANNLKDLKELQKNVKLLQGRIEGILEKMKSRHANWRKQIQKLQKDRNLSENPMMLLFARFDQESKAINEQAIDEQIESFKTLLESLILIFQNKTFNEARRGKQITRALQTASRKKPEIGKVQSNIENLINEAQNIAKQDAMAAANNSGAEKQHQKVINQLQKKTVELESLKTKSGEQKHELEEKIKELKEHIRELQKKTPHKNEGTQTDKYESEIIVQLKKQIHQYQIIIKEKEKEIGQVNQNNKQIDKLFGDLKANMANISTQTDHGVGPRKQDAIIDQINRYVVKHEKTHKNDENDDQKNLLQFLINLVGLLKYQKDLEKEVKKMDFENERKHKNQSDKVQDLQNIVERLTLEFNQTKESNQLLSHKIDQLEKQNESLRSNQQALNNIEEVVKRIEEGGQWWKRIPHRGRNPQQESVDKLINYCKDKQERLNLKGQKEQGEEQVNLSNLKNQIDDYITKLDELQDQNTEIRNKMSESKKDFSERKRNNTEEKNQKNYKQLYEDLKQKDERILQYNEEFFRLQEQMLEEIELLRKALDLERQENIPLGEFEEIVKKLDQTQNQNSQLHRLLMEMKQKFQNYQKIASQEQPHSSTQTENVLMTWKNTVEELEKQLNQLKDKHDKVIEQNAEKDQQNEQLIRGMKQLDGKYADIQVKMAQLEEKKDEEIAKLKLQIQNIGPNSSNSYEDLSKKYQLIWEESEQIKAEKDNEIKDLNAKIQIMESQYQEEMKKMKEINQTLAEENAKEKQKNRQSEDKSIDSQKVKSVQKKNNELKERIKRLQEDLSKKQVVTMYKPMAESPIFEEKYNQSLAQIKKLKTQIKQLNQILERTENSLVSIEKQNQKLQTENQQISLEKQSLEREFQEFRNLAEQERRILENKINLAEKEIEAIALNTKQAFEQSSLSTPLKQEKENMEESQEKPKLGNAMETETQFETKFKALQEQYKKYQQQKEELIQQLEDKIRELELIQNEGKDWQQKYTKLFSQFHDYKASTRGTGNGSTRRQVEDAKMDLKVYKDKNKDLVKRIKEKQTEINELKNVIKQLRAHNEQVDGEISKIKEQSKVSFEGKSKKSSEHEFNAQSDQQNLGNSYKIEISQLKSEIEELNNKILKLQEQLSAKKVQTGQYITKQQIVEGQVDEQNKQGSTDRYIINVHITKSEKDDNARKMNELKEKLENILLSQEDIMNIVQENQILKDKLDELSGKLKEKQYKAHEAHDNMEMIVQENKELKKKISVYESQDEEKSSIKDNQEVANLLKRLKQADQKINQLQKLVQQLSQQKIHQQVQNKQEENPQQLNESAPPIYDEENEEDTVQGRLQARISQFKAELAGVQMQNIQLTRSLQQEKKKVEQKQQLLKQMEQKMRQLENQIEQKDGETKRRIEQELQSKQKQIQAHLLRIKEQESELQKVQASLHEKVQEIQKQIQQKDQIKNKLQENYNNQKQEKLDKISQLEAELQKIKQDGEKQQKSDQTIKTLENKITKLEQQIAEKIHQINCNQQENQKNKKERQEQVQKIKQLEKEVEEVQRIQTKLADMQKEIKEKEEEFNKKKEQDDDYEKTKSAQMLRISELEAQLEKQKEQTQQIKTKFLQIESQLQKSKSSQHLRVSELQRELEKAKMIEQQKLQLVEKMRGLQKTLEDMSSPDEKLKEMIEQQVSKAKKDHLQIISQLEKKLQEAKGVQRQKEDLLMKLQTMQREIEEKPVQLNSGQPPIYDQDEDESLQQRLQAKISQFKAELAGSQLENMELIKKLEQYENAFKAKQNQINRMEREKRIFIDQLTRQFAILIEQMNKRQANLIDNGSAKEKIATETDQNLLKQFNELVNKINSANLQLNTLQEENKKLKKNIEERIEKDEQMIKINMEADAEDRLKEEQMNQIIEKMNKQSQDMIYLHQQREQADKIWAQRLREAEELKTNLSEQIQKNKQQFEQADKIWAQRLREADEEIQRKREQLGASQQKYESSLYENTMLEQKLKEIEQTIAKAQDDNFQRQEQFKMEKQMLVEKVDKLSAQLQQINQELNNDREMDMLKEKIQHLRKQNQKLQQNICIMEENQKYNEIQQEKEKNHLQKQLQSKDTQFSIKEMSYKQKITILEEQCKEIKETLSFEKKKRDYENLDQQYKSEIKKLLAQKVRLNQSIKKKQQEMKQKDEQIFNLKQRALSSTNEHQKELEQKVEFFESKNRQLLELFETKQRQYQDEMQDMNKKLGKYSTSIHGMIQKEKGINERVEILEDQTSIQKTTIQGLKKKNAAYQKEIQRLRDTVSQQKLIIERLESKVKEFTVKIKESRELQGRLEIAYQDNSTYKNQSHRLAQKIKQISHVLHLYQEENKQLKQKIESYQTQTVKELTVKNEKFQKIQQELKENRQIISDLQYQNKRYQTIVRQHEEREKLLRQDIVKLVQKKQKESESSKSSIKKSVLSHKEQERFATCTEQGEQESDEEEYSYDQTELEILRRINLQVADLVEINRRLQMRIALLESRTFNSSQDSYNIASFFMMFQEKMERMVQWLVTKGYIKNGQSYADFSSQTNVHLHKGNYDQYLVYWLEFVKSLFEGVWLLRDQEIREHSEELRGLKQKVESLRQMGTGQNPLRLTGGGQKSENERRMQIILKDVSYLLRQYLRTTDPEYLRLMSQSLGLDRVR